MWFRIERLFVVFVDGLIVPDALLFLLFVSDSGTILKVFLEFGLIDIHTLFVGALYFILEVTAMRVTILGSLIDFKFAGPFLPGNPKLACV